MRPRAHNPAAAQIESPKLEKSGPPPALCDEYRRCLSWMTNSHGDTPPMPEKHMGVRIEINETSPGVMVAADGTEVALQ